MNNPLDHVSNGTKYAIDAVSLVTVVGTIVSYIPAIAGVVSIIWGILRSVEAPLFRMIILKLTGWDVWKWMDYKQGRRDASTSDE